MDNFLRSVYFINSSDKEIIEDIFALKLNDLQILEKYAIKKDLNCFCKKISSLKIKLLLNKFKKNPFYFFFYFIRRLIFLFKIYTFNTQGLIIYLDRVYDNLLDGFYFPKIKILPNFINSLQIKNRKFLERGGLIIISKNKLDINNLNDNVIKREKNIFYKKILETYRNKF